VAPETINIYNTLGIIYRKRGEFRRAAECYRRAMKVSPKDENVYYNLARMYYEAGDLFLAKEILDEALLLNPGFGHAQDLLRVVSKKLAGGQPPG
jgi:Flp pilus assembly protein TadD